METFRTPSLSHAQCKASDTTHQPPLLQQVKTLQKNAKAKPCEVVQCHWELTGSEAALQSSWPSVPAARYGPAREGTAGEERARAQRQPPGPSGSTQPAPSPAGVPAAAAGSTHRHSTLPSAPSPTPQTLRLRSRPASGRGGTRPPCLPGRPPFRGRPASPLRTEPCQTGALSADSRPDLPRSEGGRHREMEGGTARPGTAPPSPAQATPGRPADATAPPLPGPTPRGGASAGGASLRHSPARGWRGPDSWVFSILTKENVPTSGGLRGLRNGGGAPGVSGALHGCQTMPRVAVTPGSRHLGLTLAFPLPQATHHSKLELELLFFLFFFFRHQTCSLKEFSVKHRVNQAQALTGTLPHPSITSF